MPIPRERAALPVDFEAMGSVWHHPTEVVPVETQENRGQGPQTQTLTQKTVA